MQRTERHIVVNNKQLDSFCFLSKNLYNITNYYIRRRFINSGRLLSEYSLTTIFARINQVDYRALPAQTSQQTIKLLYKNWKSFFKAVKDYSENPTKYKSRPQLPKYKHKTKGRNIVIFTNQQIRLRDHYIYFPKKANLKPLKTKVDNIRQVRIIPQASCYIIEVVYQKQKEEHDLDDNLYLSIDLGINNLATCISNSDKLHPLLLNGKIVKSINQYYNNNKARLQSYIGTGTSNRLNRLSLKRQCKIDNYLHHTSKFIINYCLTHRINNIVIGYNPNWKHNINISKVNNQKFVYIPYLKLIKQIEYKAEQVGINVQTPKESYTSKIDCLALETIEKHKKYLGVRKSRGLFQSSIEVLLNADVNGAINILRKVIGDSFVRSLINTGLVFNPVRINCLQTSK